MTKNKPHRQGYTLPLPPVLQLLASCQLAGETGSRKRSGLPQMLRCAGSFLENKLVDNKEPGRPRSVFSSFRLFFLVRSSTALTRREAELQLCRLFNYLSHSRADPSAASRGRCCSSPFYMYSTGKRFSFCLYFKSRVHNFDCIAWLITTNTDCTGY